MRVVVDTSVWSHVLRRASNAASKEHEEMAELVADGRVVMLGAIRQELLSGVRTDEAYRTLRERLRAFPDVALSHLDYEEAASCYNRCRARGVQGSNTDFLICAVSIRRKLVVYTTDRDFELYSRHVGVRLHGPRA